jgi:hypothetical protein
MTEAAHKRAGTGAGPPVGPNDPTDPSGTFIATPKPVVAEEIAAHVKDFTPRKDRRFGAANRHRCDIHRFRREARRAAIGQIVGDSHYIRKIGGTLRRSGVRPDGPRADRPIKWG